MGDHMQRIAREYDDLEAKIQKQKKNAKGEAKVQEYTKLQQHKLQEWIQDAPEFLQVFTCIYLLKSWMDAKQDHFSRNTKKWMNSAGKT